MADLRDHLLTLATDCRRYVSPGYRSPIPVSRARNTVLLFKHLVIAIYQFTTKFLTHAKSTGNICEGLKIPLSIDAPVPQSLTTIVLVGGAHGAIFDNRIWSRFAAYCESTLKLRCLLIAPNGRGSCRENVEFEILPVLQAEIARQTERGLTPRFALVGYSKGGLDCLHLIKRHREFAQKYVSALLTVASPLRGARSSRLKVPFPGWWAEPMASDSRPDVLAFKGLSDLAPREWTDAAFWKDFRPPAQIKFASLSFQSSFFRTHLLLMLSFLLANGPTDGVVELSESRFPNNVASIDLGVIQANHLVALPSNGMQEQIGEVVIRCLDYIEALSREPSEGVA